MSPILISILVAIIVFMIVQSFFSSSKRKTQHTQNALQKIMDENMDNSEIESSFLRSDFDSPLLKFLASTGVFEGFAKKVVKAGLEKSATLLFVIFIALFLIFTILLNSAFGGLLAILFGLVAASYFIYKYVESRIKKRNEQFVNMFPDVLDMIVRSVKSGFPLQNAINLVAENMDAPVSTEFKQVADEIALGRLMSDALNRLAFRIPEQDVSFFVVVLNVQQETGGNLAEIITNLSNIIRKRKQLRLKIKAMTAEARATGWILGALPVVLTLALQIIAPDHLEPFYTTDSGFFWAMVVVILMVSAFIIIRRMIDIDI